MMKRGIMPNEETLELACEYLPREDIIMIINQKVLPTQKCFELYIEHNKHFAKGKSPYKHHRISNDNIDLFVNNGLRITPLIIENAMKRNMTINYEDYYIELNAEIYNWYVKYNVVIDSEIMKKFMSIPDIKNIIEFKESIRNKKWINVARLGLKYEIIPDQQCFDLACDSRDAYTSIKFLGAAKMITITQKKFEESTESIEYMEFLSDKEFSFVITQDHIKKLKINNRIDCLAYIASTVCTDKPDLINKT